MTLKELLPNLSFIMIDKDGVWYRAGFDQLSNICANNFIEITVWHDGRTSFTFYRQDSIEVEEFFDNPTAKDLYDFAGKHNG